ncbi:type II toxin-antitoxin system VapC family toxin [Halomonas sp. GXIMD04776]|uniref:type II toxin-antitoxin system VapC family toxin n=1 Tax=Halomonas sp. GXIMD04776 TaxID=3415605 RepID=UPI003C9A80F9
MYLCDTNVVSELRKSRSDRANANVVAWAWEVPADQLYLSVISVLELEMGVFRVERRDLEQGKVLRRWLSSQVMVAFASRILPVTVDIARRCAALHVPDPRADRDALIAATALSHGLIVVTRNTRDFEAAGVELLNPWQDRFKKP